MTAITNEMIEEAANNHASKQLGEKQFSLNPNAVKSIKEDFISGCKHILEIVADKGEILNLTEL